MPVAIQGLFEKGPDHSLTGWLLCCLPCQRRPLRRRWQGCGAEGSQPLEQLAEKRGDCRLSRLGQLGWRWRGLALVQTVHLARVQPFSWLGCKPFAWVWGKPFAEVPMPDALCSEPLRIFSKPRLGRFASGGASSNADSDWGQ
jgi:hypothetical protein